MLEANTKGYKQKLRSPEQVGTYKQQLMLALAENGITNMESIKPAIAYYRSNDCWLPTPAEFVDKCKKVGFLDGVPEAKDAHYEYCRNWHKASKHDWSHPIVKLAAKGIGYEMKSMVAEQSFPIYERNYKVLIDRMLRGEELELPVPKALPSESTITCSRKENKSRMSQLLSDNFK